MLPATVFLFTTLATPRCPIEIYTTPGCRYCVKAKGFLRKRGAPFLEMDVSEDEKLLDDMIARAGCATLPQIFVAGEHIGGCSEMLSEHDAGTLGPKLAAVGIELLELPDEPNEPMPMSAGNAGPRARRGGTLNAPIIGAASRAPQDATAAAVLSSAMQKAMLGLLDE